MTNAPMRKLRYVQTTELKPDPRNPRTHGRAQTQAIAKSIKAFGFTAPILVDKGGRVLAGHGRLEAAKLLELEQVPVIYLENLTEAQARAYMLADNKLTDRSSWDDEPDLLARRSSDSCDNWIAFFQCRLSPKSRSNRMAR